HMGGSDANPRPGFDHWISFKGQGPYTDPTFNIDGVEIAREGYTPDLLTEYAVKYLNKANDRDEPYFLYLSHKSIHEPFTPASRHENAYDGFTAPRPDTYEPHESKPAWLKAQKRSWHGAERDFSIEDYGSFDHFFELYSECMLGVDESVGAIVEALENLGQLDETIIIYYSDNGYLIGEHGLIDKRVMYEESIRVPAFVHWPEGIRSSGTNDSFILNIDLGPTILDLAGAPIPEPMHGLSFAPLIRRESVDWRSSFLYEYFIDPNAVQTPTIFGLRTDEYSYMTYHGVWDVYELYDMQKDPQQIVNLLGGVEYGIGYGTFLRHVNRQLPELAPTVERLETELDAILQATGGSRVPKWQKD
ncbi:MAG: sulfatase/phosphatase domain-containing protein, partial [Bacteroidota bacterium]